MLARGEMAPLERRMADIERALDRVPAWPRLAEAYAALGRLQYLNDHHAVGISSQGMGALHSFYRLVERSGGGDLPADVSRFILANLADHRKYTCH